MFVAEINGQGIVAFSQPSPDDAPGWTDDEEFRSDLKPAIWLICASGGLAFHEFSRSIEVRSEVERGEVGIGSPFL